jgi:hypothetical protein
MTNEKKYGSRRSGTEAKWTSSSKSGIGKALNQSAFAMSSIKKLKRSFYNSLN